MHTRESIRALLERSDKAVLEACVRLYQRQTADERAGGATRYLNGRGFNAMDAKYGTWCAEQILAWREDPKGWAQPLGPGKLAKLRAMMLKYSGQLAEIANAKACYEAARRHLSPYSDSRWTGD